MPTRQQVHVDAILTNLSVAYMQSESKFVAHKVFPIVPVQKQSDRYFVYLREDWLRDEAAERAPATESAGGEYTIDNSPTYFCTLYAFHKDVTEADRANADNPLQPDADATDFVTQKLLIKKERLWAAKYFTPGVWSTNLLGVASAPAAGQFLQWDQASSDPIGDIANARRMVAATTGFMPNKLTLNPYVYDALRQHPAILDRIKYTERGIITKDLLAALFEVEEVVVPEAIVNTAAKGAAENNQFILSGKHALLTYSPARPGLKTPSAGYTFVWTGLLGAGAFGNRISRFPMRHLGQGTERVEGEMAFDMKVVGADLGVFFSGAVA